MMVMDHVKVLLHSASICLSHRVNLEETPTPFTDISIIVVGMDPSLTRTVKRFYQLLVHLVVLISWLRIALSLNAGYKLVFDNIKKNMKPHMHSDCL